jgi:hypothetical protein
MGPRRFFVSGGFRVWGGLLAFRWLRIGLTTFLGCFLDILGQKLIENEILSEKIKHPIFSVTIVTS